MNDEIKLANQLGFTFFSANRLFNKFYQQALEPFALTYPQYLILLHLWERDNQTLRELGLELGLANNKLRPLLGRLKKDGWIARSSVPYDKRQFAVKLTEKGKDSQAVILKAVSELVGRDHLNIERYRQALKVNEELLTALESAVKNE
ncbi:MarR family winged helix-turn-helix transcriptional regulator [Lentilactobacillus farraginis]|uniref:Organic hydroperoxide resistance transcriptional regulator n=1 Tax=Lentilactobacillus farraginis DSM 18382 = JCM 14108 TaxID=1423743 RepID=X0QC13_9LACO|nr:MarR family transcriptional regulator [Lentilactobacillus farraginis]KRM01811.1 transcription regulator [Lentilactobacillus farraginis DSM 18382 = JCM 14108]GAF36150.1 organic hydroperoxide resistance transcriptional regulator [Lentilactobacillus farraginis DSM 18382 = JCM 14108]